MHQPMCDNTRHIRASSYSHGLYVDSESDQSCCLTLKHVQQDEVPRDLILDEVVGTI